MLLFILSQRELIFVSNKNQYNSVIPQDCTKLSKNKKKGNSHLVTIAFIVEQVEKKISSLANISSGKV